MLLILDMVKEILFNNYKVYLLNKNILKIIKLLNNIHIIKIYIIFFLEKFLFIIQ